MENRDKLYIDGRWTAASGTKTLDVINASTEEVNGRELGKYGLEEFLEYKALQFKPAPK